MSYLVHHGILGQKLGVRRYQNPDGSLKGSQAREHMESINNSNKKHSFKEIKEDYYKAKNDAARTKEGKNLNKQKNELHKKWKKTESAKDYNEWRKAVTKSSDYENKRAADYIYEKYGRKEYNDFVTKNNVMKGASLVSAMTIVGLPLSAVISMNAVDTGNYRSKTLVKR